MRTRCKFTVTEVTELPSGHTDGRRRQRIVLTPVYDLEIPDDARFNDATPVGRLFFEVTNQAVIDGFKLGGQYYVDLTPCE